MAKATSVPAGTLARARALLTAAEHKIFESSFGQSLSKATHAEVDMLARRAREMRDKWRGLSSKQTRSTKRATAPVAAANARTAEKTDLLHGALERIESRLADFAATVSTTVKGLVRGNTAAKSRTKTIIKRATRRTAARPVAPARPAAAVKVAAKPAVKTPAPAKAVSVAAAVSPSLTKTVASRAVTTGTKISKKARQAGARSALQTSASTQKISAPRANQRNALSAAKASRLKLTGLDTRRTSHTASRVKAQQARRDMRSR
jgi:hypothetical protein